MAGTIDINVGALPGDDPKKQIESVVAQANENFRLIANEDRTKVTKDDAGDGRLLVGYQQGGFNNGNVGIKLSQEGVDVLTATSDQLIFSSDFNMFKIVGTGSVTLPVYSITSAAGWTTSSSGIPPSASVAHGQDRIPLVFAFLRTTGPGGATSLVLPYTDFGIISGAAYFHTISLAVDDTNLSFNEVTLTNGAVGGGLTNGGGTIDYWILAETAL